MTGEFTGKAALVTGGASGIGRAVAIALARAGANVAVQDLHQDAAQQVVDEITSAGGTALAVGGDVSNPEVVKAAVDAVVSAYGRLDLAFNNAGIGGPQGRLEEMEIDDYRTLMGVNLDSVFYGMKYEVPEMLKAGGGAIVNMSSILGLVAEPTAVPYTTAKHGVTGMTKAVAALYAKDGVRVNSIHPGYIATPLLEALPEDRLEALKSVHAMGRLGTSEEVANLVLFLLSDEASFVTGSQHVVDGGYTSV